MPLSGNNPADPDPGFKPMAAPNSVGGKSTPPLPPKALGQLTIPVAGGHGPAGPPVTRVNGTNDPRIIWEDGHVAIIFAKDFPANAGMGRSKTRADIKDALNAAVDDQLQTAPGKNSANDFVKVWLKDLLARPLPAGPTPKVMGRLPIDPSQFKAVVPSIAATGKYKGQIIPDFPHDCMACGGKFYQGMISSVHPTEDGICPATKPKAPAGRRR